MTSSRKSLLPALADTPLDYAKLRNKRVARWVITYLNELHTFGSETAHHKMQNTYPAEIDEGNLTACLFGGVRLLVRLAIIERFGRHKWSMMLGLMHGTINDRSVAWSSA